MRWASLLTIVSDLPAGLEIKFRDKTAYSQIQHALIDASVEARNSGWCERTPQDASDERCAVIWETTAQIPKDPLPYLNSPRPCTPHLTA
jgi:hypothetical protein